VVTGKSKHHGRKQEVVPNPHTVQDSYRHDNRLQKWEDNLEENLLRSTTVNRCCLLQFIRNTLDESRQDEHRHGATESKVCKHNTRNGLNHSDSHKLSNITEGSYQWKHNNLERNNHRSNERKVNEGRPFLALITADYPCCHSTKQNQ